ncbi:MAG: cyclic nucleotide-binding domain-containing protein [Gomphosphaeria aponina SAG 52.96 = DSM 107014]|uniref:Cyclic nucleotide-binding domain-containing protein n=1 Tax=Gomphosphaeria aponina SAG 52.96 = DSM 107014 TaxID=1521640 RepID=A0A941GW99_9CHRO|nr:cyclic nucleotide-binding domain-containing protein [Gomphosphaeria aponina SAG 52.96 = DSM 107014]
MLQPVETIKLFQKNDEGPKKFTAGEVIFEEGAKGEVMYGIIEGEVEMFVHGKLVETIQPGDVFGEGAIVHLDHKRTSKAVAKTDCILACLNKERFLFAVENTPLFALEVMRSYSDRFRRLKELI